MYVIGAGSVVDYISFSSSVPGIRGGAFNNPIVTPFSTGKSYVFVKYTIEVTGTHKIPSGGWIEVVFPSEYDLSGSSPVPIC